MTSGETRRTLPKISGVVRALKAENRRTASWPCQTWSTLIGSIRASTTRLCSAPQMRPLSNDLLVTTARAAASRSTSTAMRAGALPGPTPMAGLPDLYAAFQPRSASREHQRHVRMAHEAARDLAAGLLHDLHEASR